MNLSPEEKLQQYESFNNGIMTYSLAPNVEAELDTSLTGDVELTTPPKKKVNIDKEDFLKKEDYSNIKMLENPTEMIDSLSEINEFDYVKGVKRKNLDFTPFEQVIRIKESNNNPRARNPKSTAVGYYQFLWGKEPGKGWQDSIKKSTGVKDMEEFKARPDLQKKYFKEYFNSHIVPGVKKLKDSVGNGGLTDFDLGQLIHFRGLGGARDLIKNGQLNKKQEDYNPTAMDYIKR